MKRISELTNKSTVGQQPWKMKMDREKIENDHDIIVQLEAQNHDQTDLIKDMHPEFQRLCAIHATGVLASASALMNERLSLRDANSSLMSGNQNPAEDYDSVDKGLFDYLYKGYEADSKEPWSIHTDTVQYTFDKRVHADLTVEDAMK